MLKGLYVTFRNYLLMTITPVAIKSSAVSILLLSLHGSERRLNVIDRHHVDSLLFSKVVKNVDSLLAAYCCLSGFHREAQQCQQSYTSWMKMLMVSEPDRIL